MNANNDVTVVTEFDSLLSSNLQILYKEGFIIKWLYYTN